MITLATLANATAQQVFDQVVAHLRQQGTRSSSLGACRYRAGNLRCAAGCLISDDEYDEGMEENTWPMLVRQGQVPNSHEELIYGLQRVHDKNLVHNWEYALRELASRHILKYTPPNQ